MTVYHYHKFGGYSLLDHFRGVTKMVEGVAFTQYFCRWVEWFEVVNDEEIDS